MIRSGVVLPRALVDILVCPKSKQALIYFPEGAADGDAPEGFLLCPASRLRYRIDDGVPVMLVDEAEELTTAATEALASLARERGLVPA